MNDARDPQGHFATQSFAAIYDALDREVRRIDGILIAEVKRITDLRTADQTALVAALLAAKTAVEAALAAAEKAVAAALTAAKEAVAKAEEAQLRTNVSQNEFRAQLKDQAQSFATIVELHAIESALRDADARAMTAIGDLRSRLDVGPPSLGMLQARSDESVGRLDVSNQWTTRLFSVVSLLIAAAAVVALILKP